LTFSRTYDIERFWCPVDGVFVLDHWGFLQDPRTSSVWSPHSDVVPFERIQNVPVLILLGEPGAGKSQWFRDTEQKSIESIRRAENQGIWIDLGECDTSEDINNAVFGHLHFIEWLQGDHRLQLFLDGFDECHSRVGVLPRRILSHLRTAPIERLDLRIMCRTSAWPQGLQEQLTKLWDERFLTARDPVETESTEQSVSNSGGLVQAFELAPFRRDDVVTIIKGESIEEDEIFLKEIYNRQLVPFALTPQTLAFLVNSYRKTGRFPEDQVDLYREGCLELCTEHNAGRIDGHVKSPYQVAELYSVASRIAALTILCGKHSILQTHAKPNDGELSFRDICYGHEIVNGREVPVIEDIVEHALNTGLFSGRSGGRMGWAHFTYPEFLAADYVQKNHLPMNQFLMLVQNTSLPESKISPRLRDTATWFASLDHDFLNWIIENEPEILLAKKRYGISTLGRAISEKLVNSLLHLLDEGRIRDQHISRTGLGGLTYPKLSEQLKSYIADRTKNLVVRRVAIQMAEENDLFDLGEAICDIALDSEDHIYVRRPAAHALIRLADYHVKSRLKSLIEGQHDDDPDDELKGSALMALWPDFLTAEQLFHNLTVPKNSDLFGAYCGFMEYYLTGNLSVSDLPVALEWVQRQPGDRGRSSSFHKVVNSIMVLAYDHIDYPVVMHQFARAARHRLSEYEEIIPDRAENKKAILFADDARRRRIVEEMLILTSNSRESSRSEAHRLGALVDRHDMTWLLNLFRNLRNQKEIEIVAFLIALLLDTTNAQEFELVYELSLGSNELADALRSYLGPVDLDSEEALSGRRWLQLQQERSEGVAKEETELYEDAILEFLEKIESGNPRIFAHLCWRMIKSDRDTAGYDIAKTKSWEACSANAKERLIQAAISYVTDCDSKFEEPVRTTVFSWIDIAGCMAFSLISDKSLDSFRSLPASVLIKWAPLIVAGYGFLANDSVIAEAYRRIPRQILAAILNQIDYENGRENYIFIMQKLDQAWDAELTEAMLKKLNDNSLRPDSVETILHAISKHDLNAAEKFAKSKLSVPLRARGRDRMLALIAGKFLMVHLSEANWQVVWQAITGARLFGRKLLQNLAHSYFELKRCFEGVRETYLVSLYLWISREYPSNEEESLTRGRRSYGVRDIGETILRNLQDRGTVESVQALRVLSQSLPGETERLTWIIDSAIERVLGDTWTPWEPTEVLNVIQDHEKRLVQSGEQLLEVVMESICRFQQSLHDELPALRDLWDFQVGRLYKHSEDGQIPVEESVLSNRIARHLRTDLHKRGIVIGREVLIRPGQLTDIHVDAVIKNTSAERFNLVKVIIEAKGCWNNGLENDMESQLLGRYMAENACNHGLYLIGWFHCGSWDKRDYRSHEPSKEIYAMSIDDAKAKFNKQAKALSAQSGKTIQAFVLDARIR
jgi:hypothetical protein